MKYKIPKTFMGIPIDGAKERLLAKQEKQNPVLEERVTGPQGPFESPEEWIVLQGQTHGQYNYPDLAVSMHRLNYGFVEDASRQLGLNVGNTGREQDSTPYIGNITWEEALKLNLARGNQTLTPRQGIDFLRDLKKGIGGQKKIYDARGIEIQPEVLQKVYNEIVEVREPWRGEWLDADFKVVNGVLHINYEHELNPQGQLVPRISEPLRYLNTRGKKVSFTDFNEQGLPNKNSRKGDIHYWAPLEDNISVAGFGAGSYGAVLECGGPSCRDGSLGVRAVRRVSAK